MKHPAGPFAPRLESQNEPGIKFEFLGYEIYKSNGGPAAAPSEYNYARFNKKFDIGLNVIRDNKRSEKVRKRKAEELKFYVRSWMAAFGAWPNASKVRAKRLEDIDEAISLHLTHETT